MPEKAFNISGSLESANDGGGNDSERSAWIRNDDSIDEDTREPVHFRYHQDCWNRHIGHLPTGDSMAECSAMVHLPISMKKAMTMPNAKKAMDKEWDALASLPA